MKLTYIKKYTNQEGKGRHYLIIFHYSTEIDGKSLESKTQSLSESLTLEKTFSFLELIISIPYSYFGD